MSREPGGKRPRKEEGWKLVLATAMTKAGVVSVLYMQSCM